MGFHSGLLDRSLFADPGLQEQLADRTVAEVLTPHAFWVEPNTPLRMPSTSCSSTMSTASRSWKRDVSSACSPPWTCCGPSATECSTRLGVLFTHRFHPRARKL